MAYNITEDEVGEAADLIDLLLNEMSRKPSKEAFMEILMETISKNRFLVYYMTQPSIVLLKLLVVCKSIGMDNKDVMLKFHREQLDEIKCKLGRCKKGMIYDGGDLKEHICPICGGARE